VEKITKQVGGLHLVQGGRDISHHSHEEERYLEDCVLEKVQAIHNALVPGRVVHVHEEREKP
jgi:hypothetical protein